jgi:murein DD-endopeptidase MepM/ murein hydrolase activator NlpD
MWLFLAAVVASVVLGLSVWIALGMLAVALALNFWLGTVRMRPIQVRTPVEGRWQPVNSPADHVPSHRLHTYGQTWAIDLIPEPGERPRPGFEWWPPSRSADDFPGFGHPVLAPAEGVVVRSHDRERDHRSRSSWPGLALWIVEGFFRELTGPDRILGNHIVIEVAPGAYAVVAHLRRRSAKVRRGDRVRAGDEIAACGNSGSSTEPHVHFQLMDRPRALLAAGLPFRLTGAADEQGDPAPLPATGDVIVA